MQRVDDDMSYSHFSCAEERSGFNLEIDKMKSRKECVRETRSQSGHGGVMRSDREKFSTQIGINRNEVTNKTMFHNNRGACTIEDKLLPRITNSYTEP